MNVSAIAVADSVLQQIRAPSTIAFVNACSTAVLAVFAFVQVWQARSRRLSELRAAASALWIEWWRTWTVTSRWKSSNLEMEVLSRQYMPDEILPSDWTDLRRLAGSLGYGVAVMVGAARAHADLAAEQGRLLIAVINADHTASPAKSKVPGLIESVRQCAQDAEAALADAIRAGPRWLETAPIDRKRFGTMTSRFGKGLHERFEKTWKAQPWWKKALVTLRLMRLPLLINEPTELS